jgi:hypothetical protein
MRIMPHSEIEMTQARKGKLRSPGQNDYVLNGNVSLADILLSFLQIFGKPFRQTFYVRFSPDRCSRPKLYWLGKTAFLAALPPGTSADGKNFQHLWKS